MVSISTIPLALRAHSNRALPFAPFAIHGGKSQSIPQFAKVVRPIFQAKWPHAREAVYHPEFPTTRPSTR